MATNGVEMKLMVTHGERSKAIPAIAFHSQVTYYIHFVQVTMLLKVYLVYF